VNSVIVYPRGESKTQDVILKSKNALSVTLAVQPPLEQIL